MLLYWFLFYGWFVELGLLYAGECEFAYVVWFGLGISMCLLLIEWFCFLWGLMDCVVCLFAGDVVLVVFSLRV